MELEPLVSCVMPTAGRAAFAREALECWLAQTYERKELVILDQFEKLSFRREPKETGIVYFVHRNGMTLGAKRNAVNGLTRGTIIMHWDDDDLCAPRRIEDQVARILRTGAPLTAYHSMHFLDVRTGQLWYYRGHARTNLGTSYCYTKEHWRNNPFRDQQVGSDLAFVMQSSGAALVEANGMMIARNHAGNINDRSESKIGSDLNWKKCQPDDTTNWLLSRIRPTPGTPTRH